jgi:GMP synthase-like glutamine amidotransferase
VVENDPTSPLGQLAQWLPDGGLELEVVRAHAGEPLPADLAGRAAFVVLGGGQHAYPGPDGTPGAPWFPALEGLLRTAVRERVPTLGVCLGAQLLAYAHSGTVEPSRAGPEIGPGLVAKRDAAEADPIFGPVPMLPDVIQWHFDDITEPPLGAVLLAASGDHPVQAFRLGTCAWGVQFHPEVSLETFASWAADDPDLADDALVARVAALQDDLFEVWHPFATRFASLALGGIAPPPPATGLRLLGQ